MTEAVLRLICQHCRVNILLIRMYCSRDVLQRLALKLLTLAVLTMENNTYQDRAEAYADAWFNWEEDETSCNRLVSTHTTTQNSYTKPSKPQAKLNPKQLHKNTQQQQVM